MCNEGGNVRSSDVPTGVVTVGVFLEFCCVALVQGMWRGG